MKKIFSVPCFFFLVGCNNSQHYDKPAKTHVDSLMEEVLRGHDFAMSKMDKIRDAQKKIQLALDSVSKLSWNTQQKSIHYRMQLDSSFNRLTFAENEMDKWMNEFNMDSFAHDDQQRAKYLESEKIKILNVNDRITAGLQKADSVLGKK